MCASWNLHCWLITESWHNIQPDDFNAIRATCRIFRCCRAITSLSRWKIQCFLPRGTWRRRLGPGRSPWGSVYLRNVALIKDWQGTQSISPCLTKKWNGKKWELLAFELFPHPFPYLSLVNSASFCCRDSFAWSLWWAPCLGHCHTNCCSCCSQDLVVSLPAGGWCTVGIWMGLYWLNIGVLWWHFGKKLRKSINIENSWSSGIQHSMQHNYLGSYLVVEHLHGTLPAIPPAPKLIILSCLLLAMRLSLTVSTQTSLVHSCSPAHFCAFVKSLKPLCQTQACSNLAFAKELLGRPFLLSGIFPLRAVLKEKKSFIVSPNSEGRLQRQTVL